MSKIKKKFMVALFAVLLVLAMPTLAFANSTSAEAAGSLSNDGALKVALKDAGVKKSQVKAIEFENKKKSIEVEFIHKKTKTKYEYTIAKNGRKILEKEIDYAYKHNTSKAKIGKTAVLKKVAKASGIKCSVVKKAKCKYTYKKNEGRYEVVFCHKGYKYEYELLAPNGKVIEVEMDYVGK